MGSIKERLKIVARYKDDKGLMENQLEHTGEAIESELQRLETRIKEVESKNGDIEYLKGQNKLNLRSIEAPEKTIRLQSADIKYLSTPTDKEEVPTDEDGNPPGGLKFGDIFDYDSLVHSKRMDAIFIQQTPQISSWIEGRRIFDGEKIVIGDSYNWKFKFRPAKPEKGDQDEKPEPKSQ